MYLSRDFVDLLHVVVRATPNQSSYLCFCSWSVDSIIDELRELECSDRYGPYICVFLFFPDRTACAPSLPAPRHCTPPRLAHSLHCTRRRPHSATRIHTQHMSCELLAATHMHDTLHCTYTFLHPAHNERVMIFLDTASTTRAPRASSCFSHKLRASTALFCI